MDYVGLDTLNSSTGAVLYDFASKTYSAGDLIVASCGLNGQASGVTSVVGQTSGLSLTEVHHAETADSLAVFIGKATAGATEVFRITAAAASQGCGAGLGRVASGDWNDTGTLTDAWVASNDKNGSGTSTSVSFSFNAGAHTNDMALWYVTHNNSEAVSGPGGAWTRLTGANHGGTAARGFAILGTQTTFDTSASASWSTSSLYRYVGVELVGVQTPTGQTEFIGVIPI